ncbi:hypothetical protein AGLY_016929 [Aphis glycines]|uniref:Uncharacterized protein n=1 Tax=Aphis glycines TaxID=307491 RepID=A0A6G0SWA9_APHGL|nr:hypothetical protein AGLY_016929 [Aphis glycines]
MTITVHIGTPHSSTFPFLCANCLSSSPAFIISSIAASFTELLTIHRLCRYDVEERDGSSIEEDNLESCVYTIKGFAIIAGVLLEIGANELMLLGVTSKFKLLNLNTLFNIFLDVKYLAITMGFFSLGNRAVPVASHSILSFNSRINTEAKKTDILRKLHQRIQCNTVYKMNKTEAGSAL